MKLSKQDIKDIKQDIKRTPETDAYYFIVYARNEAEATEILRKGVVAKVGKLEE